MLNELSLSNIEVFCDLKNETQGAIYSQNDTE